MNLEYRSLLPRDFSHDSRVWIYQSSRMFSMGEALEIEDYIKDFCNQWLSHGAEVTAYGNLLFGQFLVLMSDEKKLSVSGCSTDASVRFVKEIGQKFGVDFFNRTNLAFIVKDKIQLLPIAQVQYAVGNAFINPDTLYFNNTVQTKEDLEQNWIIPLKNSWLVKKIRMPDLS